MTPNSEVGNIAAEQQRRQIHSEAERLTAKKRRRENLIAGLLYSLAEIVMTIIVLSRLSPVMLFCQKTGFCQAGIKSQHPFYLLLCGVALPAIIILFVSFLFSFSRQQAVAADGKMLRSGIEISTFILSSLISIMCLFAALHRWTGISDSLGGLTHVLGDCVYFSVITMTTTGLGDYHPAANSLHFALSKFFTAAEAFSGYMILGILVSSIFNIFRKQ